MKSFDDFLSTLSTKDQEEITSKAMALLTNSGETFSAKELKLAVSIAQASGLFMRELLHRYHNWLAEQM